MRRRWALAWGLVAAEYLALSLLFDLPVAGPALAAARGAKVVLPIAFVALAMGWLLARSGPPSPVAGERAPEPWNPWPALAGNVAAFAATATVASAALTPGASTLEMAALLALAALTVALALRTAASRGELASLLASRWRDPLLAMALGLLAWRAATSAEHLWGVLAQWTLHAVAWFLGVFSDAVSLDVAQRIVGLRGFELEIAPVCSGADGIGLVLTFQGLWLALARNRLRLGRALLLLPLGVIAAMVSNVVRVASLLVLGAAGHEDLAIGGFHSKLGWVFFIAIAFATVAAAERVRWFAREAPAPLGEDAGVPRIAAAYVGPLLAALGTALLTSMFTDGPLDRAYGARVLAALTVLWLVRRELPRPSLELTWTPWVVALGVSAVWIAGAPRGDPLALPGALASLPTWERALWVLTRIVGSVVVIPIIEELAFRGFLLRWLASPRLEADAPGAWTWPAVLLSSLAFGALHGSWWLGSLAGLGFAFAYVRRGSLGDAVVAHAVCNAAVAAAVLLDGRWWLWST